jgi:glycosyltransferase involved in cell wall biosynthesis
MQVRNNPLVSVIIPTYKRSTKLSRCIESVKKSSYKNTEIIVVNDNPDSNISKEMKKYGVKLIQNKETMFAVYSRDAGAKAAKGEILFFVDDDNILDKEAIKLLVSKYKSTKKVGLLGPIMYDRSGKIWFSGAVANWISPYPKGVDNSELKNELIETDVIPNAYMISRKLFFEIGMENYKLFIFHHHEELDLAQRLILKGYKNFIYTKARTMHDYGGLQVHLSPVRLEYVVRNNMIIEKIYASKSEFAIFSIFFVPAHIIKYWLYYIPVYGKDRLELYRRYSHGFREGLAFVMGYKDEDTAR